MLEATLAETLADTLEAILAATLKETLEETFEETLEEILVEAALPQTVFWLTTAADAVDAAPRAIRRVGPVRCMLIMLSHPKYVIRFGERRLF
jgi:hypothetical protein